MSLIEMRARWLKATRASKARGAAGAPAAAMAAPVSALADAPPAAGSEPAAMRLLIAATFTADPLVPYLGIKLMDLGSMEPPGIRMAPYNQIFQLCLDWESFSSHSEAGATPAAAPAEPPAAVVLLWRIEDFLRSELQDFLRGDQSALERALRKLDELRGALAALRQSFDGVIVASLPPYPHGADHDLRAARNALSAGSFHRRVVQAWADAADAIEGVSLLDLDAVQRIVGIDKSYDARKWYLYRQPFTEEFWHEAADQLSRILARQRTAAKKCIVVDCDNTLWGGIVGEDGLAGIALGEDFPGSAFRDFQQQLLTLRSKGVMLAICSKNNEADVWEVFDRHDGMVLKRADLVAHRINWQDKPANLREIAAELNIGLDSLVFVDDSPLEIAHVRSALPMVTCLQVPSDAARLPENINAFRGFDRERISAEDRSRSEMMLQERERKVFATASNPQEFTQTLQLSVDVFVVKPEHCTRVTQLINKTNQFNLTTLRKSAGEVAALCERTAAHNGAALLAWRVADRFGEYGLVGVANLEDAGDALTIETLLMSCRVLGRGVEDAVFAALAQLAQQRGFGRLRARYAATPKNALVADLYAQHGFRAVSEHGDWEADDLAAFAWPAHIERPGL